MPTQETPLQLYDTLIISKQRWGKGEITLDALYAAADAYIAALRTYKRTSGKRFAIPSRSYLIRAL